MTPLLSLVFTLTTTENPGNHEYETRCAEALWRSNDSPTQQVLRRFAHFAMFVERISIPHPECIDPTLFLILSEASAGEPLLPMLREIRCSCTVSPFFDTTILSLVGPALRQLIIFEEPRLLETAVEAHAVRRILCGLPSKAPALQDLRIYHRIRDVSPISSIGQLRGLRTLRIKSWSEASWFAPLMSVLAKLEHLRDLVLPLDHWDANTTETPITDSFPQLRRLKLDGLWYKGALCIGSMASNMPPARLEYLEIPVPSSTALRRTTAHSKTSSPHVPGH
ncbi:uncharacterized protein B0H18DRAFT_1122319 [Fomitopsis serialis]|uniref:uncharacterized protein n=1 Tax=Fomitopsis serialis TaxID=139415 RepID=UPI0020080573|nr:uncharacterized protein B0H18DRAFT_1122319 [Neoantrodia serialis]KAH9919669.1 hypothetical protein B0H18DRAFT_1122319 [Neoantrodia serialis]